MQISEVAVRYSRNDILQVFGGEGKVQNKTREFTVGREELNLLEEDKQIR